jgi:hypothetical protein
LAELRRLGDGLAVWSAAFKSFKNGLSPAQRDNDSAALALLEIQHFYSYILLSTCQTTKEKYFDSFNPTFGRIVSLAETYIEVPILPRCYLHSTQESFHLCISQQ